MKSFAPALFLSLTLALVVAVPSQAAVPRDFVGIVTDDAFTGSPAYRDKALTAQKKAGIGLIRLTFDWTRLEYKRGLFDPWSYYDSYVASAAKHGLSVLPVLFNPPKWHSSKPKRRAQPGIYPPRNFADLGTFGAWVAERYGPNGTFWAEHPGVPKVPITSYQIWNEPNLPVYWPPKPSAKRYVAMLKTVAPKIKAVDPNAEIVTGGMPDSKLSRPKLYTYISQLYAAGARGSFDTIAINAYSRTVPGMIGILRRVRGIMNMNGDTTSRIWVTEMGWSDRGPGATYKAGVKGQAKLIGKAIAEFGRNRARLNLRGFIYYSWRDGKPYPPKFRDFWGLHTGLLKLNAKPKPALKAFKSAALKLHR